jgi:hypothetical protein
VLATLSVCFYNILSTADYQFFTVWYREIRVVYFYNYHYGLSLPVIIK